MKKILILLCLLVVVMSFGACQSEPKEIILGEGDWDSNAFHDQVAKILIEEGYGVTVDIVPADTAVMISGMKAGDVDVCLELWSDNVPTYDDDIANGDYVELATNFDDNMQGLYVPKYLVEGEDALAPDLKSVEDLKDYVELFPNPENKDMGIIYGGPEGWSATAFMHKKMELYGLSEFYDFKTIDSGATLAATIASAYKKQEPWLGYYWEPTWVMGLYDMVLLEDSEYSAEDYEEGRGSFPSVDVNVVANPDVEDNFPDVYDMLLNYETSSSLTSQGLAYMQENEVEADEAAKWFLKENKDLWKSWVSDSAYDKIIKALDK